MRRFCSDARGNAKLMNDFFWPKVWNNLTQIVTQQNTDGEFKNELYCTKIKALKDSILKFAPTMSV